MEHPPHQPDQGELGEQLDDRLEEPKDDELALEKGDGPGGKREVVAASTTTTTTTTAHTTTVNVPNNVAFTATSWGSLASLLSLSLSASRADNNNALDPHGLPLIPPRTRWNDDPLNWPRWLKWLVLLQISFMAFLGPFDAAVPNPSFALLGKAFDREIEVITYSTTTAIITGGVSPFLIVPLTNVYGRRPLALISQLLTIVSHIGSARCSTFAQLLACRALNGIGFGGMMSLGTPVLNDMFFMHERGQMTGVYTVFVTNGAHVAVMFGGYLAERAGWRWDFYLPAIIVAVSFVVAILCLPETLFSHNPEFLSNRAGPRSYTDLLFRPWRNLIPGRTLRLQDFWSSFYMLKYPSVALVFWFYTWSWTFINILPALTMAKIYGSLYGFRSGPVGLCTGVPLTIGSVLGELTAGKLSDVLMYRLARRHNGLCIPEHRLHLTCLSAFLGPLGLILFGCLLDKQERHGDVPYTLPLVGLAIGAYGLQVSSTCLYAYLSDCYRAQTPETGVLMNLSRGLSFVVGFFWFPMVQRIGYRATWLTLAALLFLFWLPILALMRCGRRWRERLGEPAFAQHS